MEKQIIELKGKFSEFLYSNKEYKTFIFTDDIAGELMVSMHESCHLYKEFIDPTQHYQINVSLRGYTFFRGPKKYTKNSLNVLFGKELEERETK